MAFDYDNITDDSIDVLNNNALDYFNVERYKRVFSINKWLSITDILKNFKLTLISLNKDHYHYNRYISSKTYINSYVYDSNTTTNCCECQYWETLFIKDNKISRYDDIIKISRDGYLEYLGKDNAITINPNNFIYKLSPDNGIIFCFDGNYNTLLFISLTGKVDYSKNKKEK